MDAFSHLDTAPDAPTVDQMSLGMFWGEGVCVDVSDVRAPHDITAEHVERAHGDSR